MKARDEGGLINSEVQAAGGDEGRATTTGLQVTSDALSMNSELQVAGGGDGRTTTMDLQATPEAVLMNLKLPSLQATSEGLSVNAEKAASQVTVATAEGDDELAQQPARQSRRAGAGEQATPHELEEDFVAFL